MSAKSGEWANSGMRSNSSTLYLSAQRAINRLIRDDAHGLLAGRSEWTAGMILSHLAYSDEAPWVELRKAIRESHE